MVLLISLMYYLYITHVLLINHACATIIINIHRLIYTTYEHNYVILICSGLNCGIVLACHTSTTFVMPVFTYLSSINKQYYIISACILLYHYSS